MGHYAAHAERNGVEYAATPTSPDDCVAYGHRLHDVVLRKLPARVRTNKVNSCVKSVGSFAVSELALQAERLVVRHGAVGYLDDFARQPNAIPYESHVGFGRIADEPCIHDDSIHAEDDFWRLSGPFHTGRRNGGTSLMASAVHGVLPVHGGKLARISQQGDGARARLFLPMAATWSRL